jgi:hypothetical protein
MGADDHNPDGWTFATLHKYIMQLDAASKAAVGAAMASAKEATSKAEIATEKRFDGVNEFRQAMRDQQDTFAGKSETYLRLDEMSKKMDTLISDQKVSSGKGSMLVMGALGLGWFITTGIALLAIFYHR